MTRPVLLLHLGAGDLPETVPIAPAYGSWAPAVYTPPVIPGPELAIVAGVVTVNCDYSDFHLLLTADVDRFEFTNVGDGGTDSDVVTIDVEQTGTFTVNPGPKCTPITGVPYAATQAAGAVDVLGFKTFDAGTTWRYTVQQSVGGAVVLSPSPASATDAYDGVTPSAPSVQVTATIAGGTSPFTHAWTRTDSGGTDFLIDDDTAAAPTFSIAAGTTVFSATQAWRDTVTDAAGVVAEGTVDVTLSRTVPASSATVAATNHTITAASSDYDLASAKIRVDAAGTLTWLKLIDGASTSGSYAGEWLASGSAAAVEVRATLASGSAPNVSGSEALGVWLACTADRMWGAESGLALRTCVLLLEFRNAVTNAPLDSCQITLKASSSRV